MRTPGVLGKQQSFVQSTKIYLLPYVYTNTIRKSIPGTWYLVYITLVPGTFCLSGGFWLLPGIPRTTQTVPSRLAMRAHQPPPHRLLSKAVDFAASTRSYASGCLYTCSRKISYRYDRKYKIRFILIFKYKRELCYRPEWYVAQLFFVSTRQIRYISLVLTWQRRYPPQYVLPCTYVCISD